MAKFVYYHYEPSLAAAGALCALFAISTLLHFYQLIRTRSWYMIPLFIGGLCEIIGFFGRAVSASESPDYTLGPYIVQSILLLVAPALFAASVYMMFGNLILVIDGEKHSLIREKRLTKIFVIGDIFSFLVQSAGASMSAKSDPDAQDAGKYIIIGGLLIQLVFFGFFMLVSILFHVRVRREPTSRSESVKIGWRKHLWILYVASTLVMIRSVFRLVEYVQGPDGYLLSKEIWLYIFDALMMFVTVIVFNLVHPSGMKNILTGRKAIKILRTKTVPHLADIHGTSREGLNNSGYEMA